MARGRGFEDREEGKRGNGDIYSSGNNKNKEEKKNELEFTKVTKGD